MPPPPKRRRLAPLSAQPLTLDFDPTARQEYLSGFSKRKTLRKEAAREQAIRREREERVKERAQLREQRREDLRAHVQAVDAVLKAQNHIDDGEDSGDDVQWGGEGNMGEEVDLDGVEQEEEEYTDEEKYTTVTVEAMPDPMVVTEDDELLAEDLAKRKAAEEAQSEKERAEKGRKLRPWEKPRWDGKEKSKKKAKKFRYETKAERLVGRMKVKSRKSKAASARRGAEK